jgi:nucleoside-diphosphate-sugar epimerase
VRVFDLPSADYAGLDGEPGIEVVRGDLTSVADAGDAVADVGAIVHLAAVLPPLADRDRALTMHVNVDGTRVLLEAAAGTAPEARFVFSSSVSVYGDTITGVEEFREIAIDRPAAPDDVYAESKAASEELVQESDLAWVVLRLSGVAVPAFQEPPAEWPFTSDQRIEFVHRDDAVAALASALDTEGAERRVFNVSGGASSRTTSRSSAWTRRTPSTSGPQAISTGTTALPASRCWDTRTRPTGRTWIRSRPTSTGSSPGSLSPVREGR